MARKAFVFAEAVSVLLECLAVRHPELMGALAYRAALFALIYGMAREPVAEIGELFAHAACTFPLESTPGSPAFHVLFVQRICRFIQFRFLQKAKLGEFVFKLHD